MILSVDLLIALFSPWTTAEMKTYCYHISTWLAAFVSAFVVLSLDAYGLSSLNLCWIRRTTRAEETNELNWVFLYGPVLFTFSVSLVVLVLACVRFARRQQDLTHRDKRRNLLQYLRYLVVFGVHWLVCAILYYLDYEKGFNSKQLQVAFAAMFAIYPGLLLLVWCANTDLLGCGNNASKPRDRDIQHFSVAMRKDLMRYTKAGIIRGIHDSERLRTPRSRPNESADYYEKKRLAANIFKGQNRHYEKLGFTDYAPKVFRDIRDICNISTESYSRSFGDGQALLEKCSEGKSGMLFYYSNDRRYLVKTMTKNEHSFLLKILPTYHEYLRRNPESLLCRFLGCHSIQMPIGWDRVFFV